MYRILWNPWRYEYIRSTLKPRRKCVFCELPKKKDEEAYIVYRGKYSYVVLNAYPYNSGHLLIVPYKHTPSIEDLEPEILMEMIELLNKSIKTLRKSFTPDGFNIGLNIGRAAGAGVEEHVHIHVVPRWVGDSNFMAIIASTKTLPISLQKTYRIIRENWE
ncbi:HIT family protein [Staphylothermus hellenicus]|uniref:Histidine triad (HIT) protein n=1 Tax=Staphylothermus hellenicus (strain DSM 12710 / JCM 10830 / BK20S6-10-b1 / P8) TaxID=591019 RepID=D7D9Y4_STAHD|nr:HIT domain-containing protein [Staphylothermus hellenicus]ADI32580.1 histidine triad (HIT) protein [Staphylothermus hellenicus DSM 12710]